MAPKLRNGNKIPKVPTNSSMTNTFADIQREVRQEIKRLERELAKTGAPSEGGSRLTRFVGGQNVEKRFSQNRAITSSMTTTNGVQSMIVEKTEALSVVQTSTDGYVAANQQFYPGSTGIPWLGTIAAAFTHYQILDCEFTYVPSVPTTQAGGFMMAFTGDYVDVAPATQEAFLQSEQAILAPVYAGTEGGRALQRFGFPSGDVVGFTVPKYTYNVGLTNTPETYRIVNSNTFNGLGSIDKNLYSPGKLIYALNGVKGAAAGTPIVCGQLFVRYKLRLLGSVRPADNS